MPLAEKPSISTHTAEKENVLARSADDLYEHLKSLNDEYKSIRVVKNNALLLPMDHILQLLNTTSTEVWEAARKERRHLPVAKTLAKITTQSSALPGRSTMTKLFRSVPAELAHHILDVSPKGYIWLNGEQWRALFISSFFAQASAKNYWLQFVDSAAALNSAMQRSEGAVAVWKQYAASSLVARFGCTAFRATCTARSETITDDKESFDDPALVKCHTADVISVLLRVVAWYVADIVVTDIWDLVERDGQSDLVPLEPLLPNFDEETTTWSNPTLLALEHLAKWSGWQQKGLATTYLGKLWAKSTVCGSTEATTRIRVLRNWTQRKKGRPKFSSLHDLANAAVLKRFEIDGIDPKNMERDVWTQAVILRFAETLALLLSHLEHLDFSPAEISAVMSTYGAEYRIARGMLGRPMRSMDKGEAASGGSA